MDLFAQLNRSGLTIVMVTHDEVIARRANDQQRGHLNPHRLADRFGRSEQRVGNTNFGQLQRAIRVPQGNLRLSREASSNRRRSDRYWSRLIMPN